jgi:hypothetical protein
VCREPSIETRRSRIEQIATTRSGRQYADDEGRIVESEAFVVDLLTDLRHFCDGRGLDFERLDRAAEQHHAAEAHGCTPRQPETDPGGIDTEACAVCGRPFIDGETVIQVVEDRHPTYDREVVLQACHGPCWMKDRT